MNLETAFQLFLNLCVNSNLEKECSQFLLKTCHQEEWFGELIAKLLRYFFVQNVKQVQSLSKIFLTLNEMCYKSLQNEIISNNLFKSLFNLIEEILKPLENDNENEYMSVEVSCLEWILLFTSRLINYLDKKTNLRWEFLENTSSKHQPKISSNLNTNSSTNK